MGTRGALGFKSEGKYYITYNHFDSYPESLGSEVVSFIRKVMVEEGLSKLKKQVNKVVLVSTGKKPTVAEKKKYEKFSDTSVSNRSLDDWYCLLRKIQGAQTLHAIYEGKLGILIDGFNFLKDSLFCEYAYIINLDEDNIEFYKGFNHEPQKDNPLPFEQKPDKEGRASGDKYYPVKFVGSCNLTRIPKNWQKEFYPQEEEE